MKTSDQFCTFSLNGLYFGVEVLRVQEILRLQAMTPVPLASDAIRGLINLRGQIVTALDLRRRLDLPPLPEGAEPLNVVIRSDEGAISLLVDEIGDVVEIDADSQERPPDNLRGAARDLVRRVCMLNQKLLLILDVDRLIQLPSPASSFHSQS